MSIHPRRLRSGRSSYDVVLRSPDGRRYKRTFRTRKEAEAYLVRERAALLQGTWLDPDAGTVTFGTYATQWLTLRTGLRPRTVELYEYLLRLHLLPEFGSSSLKAITPARVRAWYAERVALPNVSVTTAAKAYRLLSTIMKTAVEDELILRSPCVLKGAGVERSAERPVISITEANALANAVEPRYQAMIVLATWAGLRFGELAGLQRADIDVIGRTVRVARQLQELKSGELMIGPPKSEAGRRRIALPPHVMPGIARHLEDWVARDPDAPVFTGSDGGALRRSNFNRRVWQPACQVCGLDGFRFHDLRHTGNTLAASTGASTKELMSRMGHASPRAALIYQHATLDRDRHLADALSALAEAADPAPARLRLVRADDAECPINVPSSPSKALRGRPKRAKSPDQPGGDDGTRTHDPLLAKQVL